MALLGYNEFLICGCSAGFGRSVSDCLTLILKRVILIVFYAIMLLPCSSD